MQRKGWYAGLAIAAVVMAIVSYRLATRPVIVERPVLGDGPPPMPAVADLVGRRLPDFTAADVTGAMVNSESLRGRVVVLSVWATWCRPCKAELPRIENEIWQKHRGRVAVVAIGRGETPINIRRFNEQTKFTFTLLPDPDKRLTDLFDGDAPIPRTYVIDREGRIVHQSVGYSERNFAELVAAVEAQLAR